MGKKIKTLHKAYGRGYTICYEVVNKGGWNSKNTIFRTMKLLNGP